RGDCHTYPATVTEFVPDTPTNPPVNAMLADAVSATDCNCKPPFVMPAVDTAALGLPTNVTVPELDTVPYVCDPDAEVKMAVEPLFATIPPPHAMVAVLPTVIPTPVAPTEAVQEPALLKLTPPVPV